MFRSLNIAVGLTVAVLLVIAQAPQVGAPAPGFIVLGGSGGRGGSGRGGNPLRDPCLLYTSRCV